MPITYSIELETITMRAWGPVSDEDLHAYHRVLARDHDATLARRYYCDLSDIDETGITVPGLREAVRINRTTRSGWLLRKQAILARRDVVFGLARMYELMADPLPWELRVFRTATEAQRWLALEDHDQARAMAGASTPTTAGASGPIRGA